MPEISRFFGIVISMYFNDHNPPRFHAEYNEFEASMVIRTAWHMGRKAAANIGPLSLTGVAGALFTPVQQRVLGLLFGEPERKYQGNELIRLAGSGTGAVHRMVTRLAQVGLVTVQRVGNQKHYQANADSPIYAELRGLVAKTMRQAPRTAKRLG